MEGWFSVLKHASVRARLLCCVAAVLVVVLFAFLPDAASLSFSGKMSLGLLLAGVVLWVCEPVPFGVSGLALIICMPAFGVLPFGGNEGPTVWVSFVSSVLFFILASFGLSAALLKTKIPYKIVYALLRISKGNTKGVILAFMLSAACVSLFVSDLPCCALFSGIVTSTILKFEDAVPGESRFGRAVMIAIPYAAAIGGEAFPSGSSMNIMAIGMLESLTGIQISFLQWAAICAPVAVVLLFVSWVSICAVHKPERISQGTIDHIFQVATKKEPFNALDWKVVGIIALIFTLWIASNWTGWDATAIAVLGLVLLFVPGIDVLTMDEYVESVSWNILLLIGCVQSLASGMQQQGAAKWLLDATIGKLGIGAGALTLSSAFLVPVIRWFLPVGPALIAITLPPLCLLGMDVGVTPVFFAVICGISASTSLMNGLDSISMIANRYEYWNLVDYAKSGVLPTIALMLCHAFLIMPIIHAVGF